MYVLGLLDVNSTSVELINYLNKKTVNIQLELMTGYIHLRI